MYYFKKEGKVGVELLDLQYYSVRGGFICIVRQYKSGYWRSLHCSDNLEVGLKFCPFVSEKEAKTAGRFI